MSSKTVGSVTDKGVEWPDLTISGKKYDKPPTQYRMISSTQVIVLDPFYPTDEYGNPLFDVEAAISKLLGTDLKPEDAAKVQAEAVTPSTSEPTDSVAKSKAK